MSNDEYSKVARNAGRWCGGVTVTVKEQEFVLSPLSTAVQVTVVSANRERTADGGMQLNETIPQSSLAAAAMWLTLHCTSPRGRS